MTAIGIRQAENGIYHFSPAQIASAARELGATDDEAAGLVEALLQRAYAAEARRAVSRAVVMLRGDEVA